MNCSITHKNDSANLISFRLWMNFQQSVLFYLHKFHVVFFTWTLCYFCAVSYSISFIAQLTKCNTWALKKCCCSVDLQDAAQEIHQSYLRWAQIRTYVHEFACTTASKPNLTSLHCNTTTLEFSCAIAHRIQLSTLFDLRRRIAATPQQSSHITTVPLYSQIGCA